VSEASARIAYLLSASAVEYLFAESGGRGAEVFLERWRESGDFESSIRRTFGLTTSRFETLWVAHVKNRFGWFVVLTQTAFFWVIAAILLLPVLRSKRRRRIERTARLRALDPPSSPDFWTEEGPAA
jgi:hypothetical protein